jgi:translation initiation factor IF-2
MTEVSKGTRLSKAAREFNVGIHTIVEFLSKKGHDIEPKPNTKIGDDLYDMLIQEFQGEKTVKEESKKIILDAGDHRTISLEDKPKEGKTETTEKEQEELIIKTVTSGPPKVDAEEEKAPAKEKKKEPAEKKPEAAVKKAEKAEPAEKKTAPKAKTKKDKEEKESKEVEEEKESKDLKVVGKIDLDSINQKTRPTKKTKTADKKKVKKVEEPEEAETKKTKEAKVEEPDESKDKKVKEAEAKVAEPVEEASNENFIPTEVEKLSGLKILDKIDLPEVKKQEKKPVASSKDEKIAQKKKKRKRISKPQGAEAQSMKQGKGGKETTKGRGRRRREQKPEVSEEEIQKQIKETLSRLSPTGKSKASKHRRTKRAAISQQTKEEEQKKLEEEQSVIKVTEFVTVNELANLMDAQVNEVISACMTLGLFVSINQRLDAETLVLVAEEFGYKVEFVSVEVQEAIDQMEVTTDDDNHEDRSPIVTVMGHVDHGKTKLLDYIRNANVVAGEAGGITQHIGAYEVTLENEKKITFLDTPGHEAFTAMRARGAKLTDIAIIVVAADDDVMPQTKEAINHAQAAGVPIIFAINKIDKANANPDKIKQALSEMNILVEEWGGKFQSQDISAKSGTNIDELLEKVLLEAEMLELKGNSLKPAMGTVIESSLDKGKGYVAKILVQNGTLHTGDMVLAGAHYGKVKAMYNERNQLVKETGPSSPILMLGLNGAPQAGDGFNVMADEREAKSIATKRQQLQREQGIRTQKHITLDEIGRRIAIGEFKELNLIVKGDVDGSVEALSDSLLKLSTGEVQVNVIHKSVGAVTESDVLLASASNAIVLGFQVRPTPSARKLAEQEQIDIRLYSIIYQAIEEIKAAIEGMLSPDIEEKIVCNLEIRETFKITKVGTIAGCMVLDGKITRKTNIRLIRDGIVVYTGKLGSLKRFKDDVKEVQAGYECGLNIEGFNDIKVGDIIEGYEEIEVKRTL